MASLSRAREGSDLDKVLQIARGGGAGRFGDADIVVGAEPTLKAVNTFPEHASDSPPLAVVERFTEAIEEMRLGNMEVDAREGVCLSFQDTLA